MFLLNKEHHWALMQKSAIVHLVVRITLSQKETKYKYIKVKQVTHINTCPFGERVG